MIDLISMNLYIFVTLIQTLKSALWCPYDLLETTRLHFQGILFSQSTIRVSGERNSIKLVGYNHFHSWYSTLYLVSTPQYFTKNTVLSPISTPTRKNTSSTLSNWWTFVRMTSNDVGCSITSLLCTSLYRSQGRFSSVLVYSSRIPCNLEKLRLNIICLYKSVKGL